MTVGEAFQLLRLKQRRVHGVGRLPGRVARPRTLADLRPSILKKLARLARAERLE